MVATQDDTTDAQIDRITVNTLTIHDVAGELGDEYEADFGELDVKTQDDIVSGLRVGMHKVAGYSSDWDVDSHDRATYRVRDTSPWTGPIESELTTDPATDDWSDADIKDLATQILLAACRATHTLNGPSDDSYDIEGVAEYVDE